MEWVIALLVIAFIVRLIWFTVSTRRVNIENRYLSQSNSGIQRVVKYTQWFPRFDELDTDEIVEAMFTTQIVAGEAHGWEVPSNLHKLHAAVLSFLDSVAAQWDDVPNISESEVNARIARVADAAAQVKLAMGQTPGEPRPPRSRPRTNIEVFFFGQGPKTFKPIK